ncbi:MAG: Na-translocating system protein MpsB [Sulfurimonas sp.]|nr:Na-translocating system protein MpsB [Sulfurimonas sp.]MDQ7060341.1 Na-translocating system protein MpsB [Sulfurimonas sp.]
MGIIDKLDAVKNTVPHYWPIGSFIHHNPLKGFEDTKFKDALQKAKKIYGGRVYMEPSYYLGFYKEGKISHSILEENLKEILEIDGLAEHYDLAMRCLLEVNPEWNKYRSAASAKDHSIDEELQAYLDDEFSYHNKKKWLTKLTKHMTLYEINDILFYRDDKEVIEKNIIEYISRFLDEGQTTFPMENRELGMFETFKLYEDFDYPYNAEAFVEESLEKLQVKNKERYLLTHVLKLHGWAGFIKYRSEDPNYFSQQQYPSSLIDYMAIRLYYEVAYLKHREINTFKLLDAYIEKNGAYTILKLVKSKNNLPGKFIDAMEESRDYDAILESYTQYELELDAKQVQLSKEQLNNINIPLVELAKIMEVLREEEGYIWMKSLEDTYIQSFIDDIDLADKKKKQRARASATFCLDVRSEVIRRSVERSGPYETFGAGGFLGFPIAFVEFDKAHEVILCPAVVKPGNIVFELPIESHKEYSVKKTRLKTTKKVLSDLKNNPYTPYVMVEAIGWIFGIKLFGKTFAPEKTNKFFKSFKAEKPKTRYTLDKFSDEEIELYINQLHIQIISSMLVSNTSIKYTEIELQAIRDHLVSGTELSLEIVPELLEKLKNDYQVSPQDYEYQKKKLAKVGFTLEEKVEYLYKLLTMVGQVENFAEFVIMSGHESTSDNNPFESALDCGACGGSSSLPNNRAICMIANSKDVREALVEKGIIIPDDVKFIPALHITSTDEMKFYDTDILNKEEMKRFLKIMIDFNQASRMSRRERADALPYTNSSKDIFLKSMDWSEPRPEWGLAGNMGVFAGPRDSVKHMKFNNRLFMHSYDESLDNGEADILTRIFDGPLVVGEWINLEHYFSTVDNTIYGAGSKVYHNIVSKIGVFNGNYSDLKIGLPMQSVFSEGKAYHEPVRLLTYMEASLETVGKAVERSIAKEFILNEWIRPIIIDKKAKKVYSFESGDFKVIKELK